ncbi:MAG: hypothetical protein JSS56_05625 [Proteobacteria bacterium]|nr:hypothetical protein [Pseudomonadota bacterium]
MTTYIYIPVLTPEMASIAKKWNLTRIAQGKAAYPIIQVGDSGSSKALRREFGGGKLGGVASTDRLYVLSHGVALSSGGGAVMIGNDRGGELKYVGLSLQVVGGTPKNYLVDELSRAIEREGLTKSFVDLRLYCCCVGVSVQNPGGRPLQPYAQRLKASLVGRGYNNVIVTGYLGDVVAEYSEYFAPGAKEATASTLRGVGLGVKMTGDTYAQRAKDHSVRF